MDVSVITRTKEEVINLRQSKGDMGRWRDKNVVNIVVEHKILRNK